MIAVDASRRHRSGGGGRVVDAGNPGWWVAALSTLVMRRWCGRIVEVVASSTFVMGRRWWPCRGGSRRRR